MNITLQLVSGGTGSLKPVIESFNHWIDKEINSHLYKYGSTKREGKSTPVINITQLTELLIKAIVFYHQEPLRREYYQPTADMIDKETDMSPIGLWEYGTGQEGRVLHAFVLSYKQGMRRALPPNVQTAEQEIETGYSL